MNKCVVITYPGPLDAPGGGTRSCLSIARQLEALGVEVILISTGSNSETRLANTNIPIISVVKHKLHYLLSGISVAKVVKKEISNNQSVVDAVISWDYEGAFLRSFLADNGIPFCMIAARPSYKDWKERKTRNWIKSLADYWFRWIPFKEADVVFVSSNFTKDEMIHLFHVQPERIKKIYRGIDSIFAIARAPTAQPIKNFIFYGSFAQNKGVYDVISALSKVDACGYKDWQIKLAGWGYEQELKAAIRKQKLDQKVILLGKLAPKELVKELEWAHLAILPSRAESFGRAIAEAQAASLAVISYDSGSIPEIVVNDTTGWIVPQGEVDLLANAIIKAIQNPIKVAAMGLAGHEHVAKKFTWEQTVNLMLEGIQEAKLKIGAKRE